MNLFRDFSRTAWRWDQPIARLPSTYTGQHITKRHGHPCLEQDLNPQSHCSSNSWNMCLIWISETLCFKSTGWWTKCKNLVIQIAVHHITTL